MGKRGVARSSVLITEALAGNVVGSDPHKRTVTTTVLDGRGGVLGTAHHKVSGDGHRAMEAWVRSFGPVVRWGVEGAASWGRHTAMFLCARGYDVRDVCPNRTHERGRARQQGKSDALDAERIARETLAHPLLPLAFKRSSAGEAGADVDHELLTLWHGARRSVLKSRQHLVNEAEFLFDALPETLRRRLPDTKAVRPRLAAAARLTRRKTLDPATTLRLALLREAHAAIVALDGKEREVTRQLRVLVRASGSTLGQLCGLSTRSVAELLVEVGDPRRFTEGGFARFNGTAPLPASTAEGPDEPVRHRWNPGGNRRVNAVLHRMAVTQLRCEPRAQAIFADARRRGHSKKEARRILKRHLSDVIYRRMIRDQAALEDPAAGAA